MVICRGQMRQESGQRLRQVPKTVYEGCWGEQESREGKMNNPRVCPHIPHSEGRSGPGHSVLLVPFSL
jgi:hypothetical protein